MNHGFKIGDKVGWHAESGLASGTIIKVHTSDTDYQGHLRHCSDAIPQYEIDSSKTDHIAMHLGAALHLVD